MKSLEEIYIIQEQLVMKRGTDGITRQVPLRTKRKLEVKTINSSLRLVHWIVDSFIISIFYYLIGMSPFMTLQLQNLIELIFILIYPMFYTMMEYHFQQTIGKMLTGHVVINEYAESPSFVTCLLRTCLRIVPFEYLSCTGSPSRGWHDKWSKTYVVPKGDVKKLQKLLQKHNN